MGAKEQLLLRLAKHWISGVDLPSAIRDAKIANSKGLGVVLNYLGEDVMDPARTDADEEEYKHLQAAIAQEKIDGFPSIKLTQIGLAADPSGASRRLRSIAQNSETLNQLLWLDMESSKYTDATLSIYLEALQDYPNVGVALQAYMKRSEADLKLLLDRGAHVRLVKGAYRESQDQVYARREEVSSNYSLLMKMLFERGEGFAIATHDATLVDEAKKLAESSNAKFRFEMLKGIRDKLKLELVNSGYSVYEYLPYGNEWFAYSKRRISEHPSNVWLLLRSLI